MTSIGCIFHIGLYSIPAFDCVESAKRRSIQNGSEWYLKRLTTKTGSFHPTSGWKETQEYHKLYHSEKSYFDFSVEFNQQSKSINFDEWMTVAKEIGAQYVIITTRHHDGWALWPTITTPNHAEVNLVENFVNSARKFSLKVGFYYSWTEFDVNPTKEYINTIIVPQINELIRYGPDIWWFDGDWTMKSIYAQNAIEQIVTYLRLINPHVEINDRLATKSDKLSTYHVYADRYIPKIKPPGKWQHINTVGFSWGLNKQQKPTDYKTGAKLLELYKTVTSLEGDFLINMGPYANGALDIHELTSLLEFSKLRKEEEKT